MDHDEGLLACSYLNDGVAELKGVHELDQGREQEPVVLQKAVPFLIFLFQLGRQGRVETTESGCKHLCSEIKTLINTFPRFLTCNKQLPGDATATGPDRALGSEVFQHQRLSARKDSTAGDRREGQLQQRGQKHQRSSANTYTILQVV